MTEPRFANQVALITGGASGIGKAIADRLASEGALVTIIDLDQAGIDAAVRAGTAKGWTMEGVRTDITDDAAVAATVAGVVGRRGRLDIAINCAGIAGPTSTKIAEVGVDDFDKVCRINLRGSFLITKHAVRAMTPRGYGRVLLVASIAGKEGNPGMVPYSTSKAGVIGLAKSVGKEYADTGITVNALAPAVIRTKLLEQMDQRQIDYMTAKIPMQRTGTLDEVAAMACWIVSREASFNTACCFDLSGGRATY
jgi:NAD(P)-dependent dehydrogenase (short-subunit alcohol dehydrogenase family)